MASYAVRCAVAGAGEAAPAPGPAVFTFSDGDGFVTRDGAPPLQFDLAEVIGAESSEGELRLVLLSGLSVRLTGMGRMAAELIATFSRARRDRTAASFRFGRPVADHWDECDVFAPGATPARGGLRLFGSLLGVVPDFGEPAVVCFADIRGVTFDATRYQVVIETTVGGSLRVGRLARRSTPFLDELMRARLELVTAYQAQLKDVLPHIDEIQLQRLSDEWREGISVPAEALEARSKGTAARLLEFLPSEDRKVFVGRLSGLFREPPRFGFYFAAERALDSVGTRPFEPFALFQKAVAGGFAAAWEALGEMGTATYVFRGREADLAAQLSAALREIRFAREPVYLSEAELLTTGEHRLYVPLLRRSKHLAFLKERFAGRVLHIEPDTYPARVEALCEGRS
jgi:hypothetical protein